MAYCSVILDGFYSFKKYTNHRLWHLLQNSQSTKCVTLSLVATLFTNSQCLHADVQKTANIWQNEKCECCQNLRVPEYFGLFLANKKNKKNKYIHTFSIIKTCAQLSKLKQKEMSVRNSEASEWQRKTITFSTCIISIVPACIISPTWREMAKTQTHTHKWNESQKKETNTH